MPSSSNLTPELALTIALDALREAGLDQQALFLENHELLRSLTHNQVINAEYGDSWCEACGQYGNEHGEDCFLLHTWKHLGSPQYTHHEEMRRQRLEAEEARRIAREERERNRCPSTNAQGRCREQNGHAGEHRYPVGMSSINDWLKQLYQPQIQQEPSVILNPRDYSVLVQELGAIQDTNMGMQRLRMGDIDVRVDPTLSPGTIIVGQSPNVWNQMGSLNPGEAVRAAVERVISQNPVGFTVGGALREGESLFGLDRSADTVRLSGISFEENDE